MIRSRLLYGALLGLGLGLLSSPTASWISPAVAEEGGEKSEKVRPEIGKPVQEAQGLMKQGKFKEALAKLKEADAVANKTAYESYALEFTRMSAANSAGDIPQEIKSFEAVSASGRLPAATQLQLTLAIADQYYRAGEYAEAITWLQRYAKQGGTEPSARTLLYQAYYQAGDFAGASKELKEVVGSEEKAGRTPSEGNYQLLANCYLKLNDKPGYESIIEKLLVAYPKRDYWLNALQFVETRPGFSDRLTLDLERLRVATDTMGRGSQDAAAVSNQYFDMIQLALQAGYAGEAKTIADKAFGAGILGAGGDADRQKRLRDLVNKTYADDQKGIAQGDAEAAASKDGNALVNQGFNYIAYGQFPKGLDMMEQGIKKGGLKHPEDAKLHLGYAYLQAGQKPKAIQVFKTVQGADGTADLARLWIIYAGK
jgi:tetratricopeptide (TPR) repeat protein